LFEDKFLVLVILTGHFKHQYTMYKRTFLL